MRARAMGLSTHGRRLTAVLLGIATGAALLATPVATAAAAPPPDANPPTQTTVQAAGESRLETLTGGKVKVAESSATGLTRFIGTTRDHAIPRAAGVSAGASGTAKARAFMSAYGDMFGLTDQASELQVEHDRGTSVKFQQRHEGVPILGGELIVDMDEAGNVLSVSGETSAKSTVGTKAGVTATQAKQLAAAVANKNHAGKARIKSAPSLWIYDPRLLGGGATGPARLVWRVEAASDSPEPYRDTVLVDAQTGGIALRMEELTEGLNRFVCNRNNVINADETCTLAQAVRTEGQAATGNTDVDLAYDFSGDTYNYYLNRFGRDSIDNAGMTLISQVKFCPDAQNCPYANAYWNGSQMTYGDGYASADDVVGHELSHGVTEHESHLFYWYQSGAINESFSDVFGELMDQQNGRGTDTAAVKWKMGEDLSIGAIRDMSNPPAFSDPDRMGSANYYTGQNDSGGVHTNSGVNNKAAFLMTDGGTFNGQTITGLGPVKTGLIYYEVNRNLITSAADYVDLGTALPQACNNLVGTGGIVASDCNEVTKIVTATEMLNGPPAAASANEAPICPASTAPSYLFNDNLENTASGNWTRTVSSGSQSWAYPQNPNIFTGFDATYATSGETNMFGGERSTTSDTQIARTGDVVPPAGKTTYLRFRHAFAFENTYDGGRVEYSTNAGGSWTDAGSLFTDNGYNSTASSLGSGAAFSGDSHGYYSSRLNLTSLAGQNVRYRFRLGSDSSVNVMGWFIDDVQVYTCEPVATVPGAPTIGTASAGNASATLTWTAPASDGGSAITGYVVTPYVGASAQATQTFNSTATTQNITGLVNGSTYTFKVAAINAVGTGPQSGASNAVVPSGATAPGAPTIGTATAGNGQATLTWSAPGSNGGSAITGYVVTPYIGASAQSPQTFNSTATSQTITGLTNGTTYTFKVAAKNAIGTGADSAASNAVTVGAPAAPGFASAQPGNLNAKVAWFAPNNNGSAITGYTITPYIGASAQSPQVFNSTATSQTVTGLTNGTTYTFKVAATNANGTGPASTTPAITVGTPNAPGFPNAVPGTTSARLSWLASNANGAPLQGYVVTPYIGSTPQTPVTFNNTNRFQTITGLTSGVSYSFKVAAFNSIGTGPSADTKVILEGSPEPPAFQAAFPANGGAKVKFTPAPSNSGPIISYTVWPVQGSTVLAPQTFNTPSATSLNVTGLTNGVTYSFRVAATNSVGTGPYATTNTVVAGTPTNPSFVSAQPGNGSAKVAWQASADNGSAITSYVITPYIGTTAQAPQTFNSTATTQTVTGLTNGTSYTFKVHAVNGVGAGPDDGTWTPIKVGTPTSPGFPNAKPGNASAVLTWQASAANGSAITGYVVTPVIGSTAQAPITFNSTATTQTITGLTNGVTYTFRVAGINAVGTGPYGTTNSVKVGTPSAPAKPTVAAGAGSVTVNWVAPADNGSAITGYIVTPIKAGVAQSPQSFDASTTSRVISGLTPGSSYTFTVVAVNAVGQSAPSPASNAAVPT